VDSSETIGSLRGSGSTVLNGAAVTLTVAETNSQTYAGVISGAGGITKSGIGRLSLSGSSSYNGATAVSAGELNLSGGSITNSAVTVASGASLSGYGSVGTIGGAGAINPGNSPGILTTPQVDPSGGTDFNLEMTGTAPTYNNASNSVNDVIRITGVTPFSGALAAGNGINIYFSGDALFTGSPKTITGGFFTDQSASFADFITNATYNYYFANGFGTNSYNGVNYYSKAQYETAVLSSNLMTITITTVAQTANFGSGNVNGQVMQIDVIPEPSTYALLVLAVAGWGAHAWRRRKSAKVA
jgi:autotransporter-associated beta strand protein